VEDSRGWLEVVGAERVEEPSGRERDIKAVHNGRLTLCVCVCVCVGKDGVEKSFDRFNGNSE